MSRLPLLSIFNILRTLNSNMKISRGKSSLGKVYRTVELLLTHCSTNLSDRSDEKTCIFARFMFSTYDDASLSFTTRFICLFVFSANFKAYMCLWQTHSYDAIMFVTVL